MAVQQIIFSPCLLYENENFFDWQNLYDTLKFIYDFLDCKLVTYKGSFFHIESWYTKPKCDVNMMNYFSQHILPYLQKLSEDGEIFSLTENLIPLNEVLIDSDFKVTNKEEFELILSYLYFYNINCLMFVGLPNYNYLNTKLCINYINANENRHLLLIKNPWLDETGYFNSIIKKEVINFNNIFPCKELCTKIGLNKLETGNISQYKKYGEIIALRNKYYKLPYSDRQYKNVPYYMRYDGKYIICLDTLHCTYEVFKRTGSKYEDYQGEYNFSCEKIISKSSPSESHICYKYY